MIPVNEPILDGNEKKYLNECIDTGWISSGGPFVARLEREFSAYIGMAHGITVANGTAALETALHALGVRAGDEVIMPSFTIISCAAACLRLGAVPVLVDIDPEIWCMDVNQIEACISGKTKVVMPVHIYGHPVDMDRLFELKEKYGFKILEDASEAHGAEYYSTKYGRWLKCGAMGDASTFSFYANKIISSGEGGIVLTNDVKIADACNNYRNLYFGSKERFRHEEIGYNFRMTNLQAAVGVAQLEQIDRFVKIKRECGKYYEKHLAGVNNIRFAPVKKWAQSVYWMYAVELSPASGFTAETFTAELKKREIGTRPFFRGLHSQPALKNFDYSESAYPKTDYAYKYGFYLPSGLTLTTGQVDAVTEAVKEIMDKGVCQ